LRIRMELDVPIHSHSVLKERLQGIDKQKEIELYYELLSSGNSVSEILNSLNYLERKSEHGNVTTAEHPPSRVDRVVPEPTSEAALMDATSENTQRTTTAGNLVARGSHTPGSRSLEAGGEFLKALASDLTAVVSRLRLWLIAEYRRTGPLRASALRSISGESVYGRILRFLRVALLGLLSGSAVVLVGAMLWVLYGSPTQPRSNNVYTPGARLAAGSGESLGGVGPLEVTGASRRDLGREPGAQGRPVAEALIPPAAPSDLSGSSSVNAAEQEKAQEAQTEARAGADQPQSARTETQDPRPIARQQETATALTDSHPRMQCNVDLCAAKYRSFNAADCTYQPYGGGPRSFCELTPRSADGMPQTSPAATKPRSEATDTRVAERPEESSMSAMPARPGPQCNVDTCAATHRSFRAADCTYQPYGGGPRRICEQ
jgi:hypothetical protein